MSKLNFDKLEIKLFAIAESAGYGVGKTFYDLMPKVVKIYLNSNFDDF